MTEKELRSLHRQDLLQLLLAQSREVARLKEENGLRAEMIAEQGETLGRLKERLNAKDEQIEHLKGRLNKKDEAIGLMREELKKLAPTQEGEAEDRIRALLRDQEELRVQLRVREDEIRSLKEAAGKKDAALRQLQARLNARDAVDKLGLDTVLEEFRKSNETLKEQLREREAEVEKLRAKIVERDSDLHEIRLMLEGLYRAGGIRHDGE